MSSAGMDAPNCGCMSCCIPEEPDPGILWCPSVELLSPTPVSMTSEEV